MLVVTAPTNSAARVGQGLLCEYWEVPITVNPGVSGRTIAAVVDQTLKAGAKEVEVSKAAEDAWVALLLTGAGRMMGAANDCTPGYYNNEGNVRAMNARNGSYGAGPVAFVKVLEDWRAEGGLAGLELT